MTKKSPNKVRQRNKKSDAEALEVEKPAKVETKKAE